MARTSVAATAAGVLLPLMLTACGNQPAQSTRDACRAWARLAEAQPQDVSRIAPDAWRQYAKGVAAIRASDHRLDALLAAHAAHAAALADALDGGGLPQQERAYTAMTGDYRALGAACQDQH